MKGRGVWLVDMIGSELIRFGVWGLGFGVYVPCLFVLSCRPTHALCFCSRAIIRKGDSFIASRLTPTGTRLSLHDACDAAAAIPAAKFWFEGREFAADSDGCAVIPFMDHDKSSIVVATAPGGHACARHVTFAAESWDASVAIIAPHESFVAGCSTSILLRFGLFLSAAKRLRMPLSLLQSPSLSLDARDERGATVQASSMKVAFDDSSDLVVPWTYPVGCCILNVNLSATVALRSSANGTTSITANTSVQMPPAPSSFQPDSPALIQAASTRSDVIQPHLRLADGRYWLDVSTTIINITVVCCQKH